MRARQPSHDASKQNSRDDRTTVSVTVRDTVAALAALHPDGVTATALAEKMGLDKSAARRRLLMAKRDSYLENREER